MEPKLEPSIKELALLKNVCTLLFGVAFALVIGIVFMCAKVSHYEYRPVVTTTVTRALNTAYQPSLTRYTLVSTSVGISSSLSLTGGQSGTITLQTSPDNITYTIKQTATNNNTGSLTIGLNTTQAQVTDLVTIIPPGYYYKFVSSGTSTFSILTTDETSL